jgi:hypothetical protein
MIPQPPAKSVRPSCASARIRASVDGGWMSEKHPLLAEEEECFFLTSPFIEPDGLEPQRGFDRELARRESEVDDIDVIAKCF